jgi:uncharacterized protein YndB with AHSA1/START domain
VSTDTSRTHSASRVINASPTAIYRAFLDPEAVATWRPPKGMTAQILAFEAREGGTYRMAFVYSNAHHALPGKTSEHVDAFCGRFIELVANVRIIERVRFETDDPDLAGVMTITTTLVPAADGTRITIRCENVPAAISESDHLAGMASTLDNLASFVE